MIKKIIAWGTKRLIWLIIIAGFGFVIGNATYTHWHNDPKLVWVPLTTYLFLMAYNCLRPVTRITKRQEYFLTYFILLAGGDIIKQLFYTDKIKQINDYVWGGLVTLVLIIVLWVTRKQTSSGKARVNS